MFNSFLILILETFIFPGPKVSLQILGSAALGARSANLEARGHPRTSLAGNTPYIITIDRWDTPRTVGGTIDAPNLVMLKVELFEVRSCSASLPRDSYCEGEGVFSQAHSVDIQCLWKTLRPGTLHSTEEGLCERL